MTSSLSDLLDDLPAGARGSISRLLSRVVHDLRTPLSALTMDLYTVRGILDAAGKDAPDGATAAAALPELDLLCVDVEQTVATMADYISALAGLASSCAVARAAAAGGDPGGDAGQ